MRTIREYPLGEADASHICTTQLPSDGKVVSVIVRMLDPETMPEAKRPPPGQAAFLFSLLVDGSTDRPLVNHRFQIVQPNEEILVGAVKVDVIQLPGGFAVLYEIGGAA